MAVHNWRVPINAFYTSNSGSMIHQLSGRRNIAHFRNAHSYKQTTFQITANSNTRFFPEDVLNEFVQINYINGMKEQVEELIHIIKQTSSETHVPVLFIPRQFPDGDIYHTLEKTISDYVFRTLDRKKIKTKIPETFTLWYYIPDQYPHFTLLSDFIES